MTAAVTGTEATFSVGRGNHRTWEILTAALSWFRAAESQKAWLHRGEKHINTACCAYCSAVPLMANLCSINLKNKTPVGHRKEEFVMLKNIFANCHMILSLIKKKCLKSVENLIQKMQHLKTLKYQKVIYCVVESDLINRQTIIWCFS